MGSRFNIRTSKMLQMIVIFLAALFCVLYYYRKPIKEHKVTKAKMEMFRRMLKTEPEQWGGELHEVIDSMIINPSDTTINPSVVD